MNMPSNRIHVTVIIPTYNESENIRELLPRVQEVLSSIPHEIIVVDDNSPDGTWEVVEQYASENPDVRVIRRLDDRGLSSAVVTGMEVGAGEVFAVMDADLQHDEAILPLLVQAIREDHYDIAIGSRGAEGGSYGEWSKRRRFISWVAARLARLAVPAGIRDPMSGFFAVSRSTFQKSANRLNPRGFKILLELIARNKGIRIKEIGYTFRNRIHGETKLSGSVIRNYLLALFDLRFGKYISSTFFLYALVGLTGVVVNLTGFLIGEQLIGLPHITTGFLPFLDPLFLSVPFGIQLSIFSNYLLNNYLTFFEYRHRRWKHVRGFFLFESISLFGLLLQFGVFQLLHVNGFLQGILDEQTRQFVNNGIGIVAATASNYYLNLNLTWKRNLR